MKRFIIGLLILGAIVAVVATARKRRSGSDVGWDELASDTLAKESDSAEKALDTVTEAATDTKEAAADAANKASDDITVVVEEAERSTS